MAYAIENALVYALRSRPPKIYLDSNVILDILRSRQTSSVAMLEQLIKRSWKLASSFLALMELLNREQERRFVEQRWQEGETLDDIFRRRHERNLTANVLDAISRDLNQSIASLIPTVEWLYLDEDGWNRAIEVKASTNLSSEDCIHLAIALISECDIIVTRDTFFARSVSDNDIIAAGPPEQLMAEIARLGL